ncbi:MAG TPA: hypothetical protein VLA12_09655, partial [Planctomycetaceae bacterium]|nr:hypothetical protein [Planctomycetaceae bacterium]
MTEESHINDSKETSWAPPERIAGLSPRRFRLILAAILITGLSLAYYFLVTSPLHKPHLRLVGLSSPGETFNSSWSVRGENSDLYVDQTLHAMADFS